MKLRLVAALAVGVGVVTGVPIPSGDAADCDVSGWTYSACEAGRQVRTRYVVQDPRGRPCPVLEQEIWCEPVHCDVSDWSAFAPCDATGHKTRTREVVVEPRHGGRACPHLVDRKLCAADECRVCDWSDWACDPRTGSQRRVRRVLNERHALNASSCPALVEAKPCDPVDCVLGDAFEAAGACDPLSGTQPFRLQVLRAPAFGGRACAQQHEVRSCAVSCQASAFGPWSACDSVTGLRRRARVEEVAAKNGGAACPPLVVEAECPVACAMTEFSDWTACEPRSGTRSRSRRVLRHALNGGAACPSATDESESCDVDCVVAYTAWSPCGGANSTTQTRTGVVLVPAQHGGRACPPAVALERQERECGGRVDCVCPWGPWGECWADGFEYRTRRVTVEPTRGGKQCPPLARRKQRRPCRSGAPQ